MRQNIPDKKKEYLHVYSGSFFSLTHKSSYTFFKHTDKLQKNLFLFLSLLELPTKQEMNERELEKVEAE
jgi:hypothetical protein